jgi:hypothetical protein
MIAVPKDAIIQTAHKMPGLDAREDLWVSTYPYSQARKDSLIVDSPSQVFLFCGSTVFIDERLEKANLEQEGR